jgi:hypothetical protein
LRMWGLDCQKPCSTAIFESSNNWWLCLTVFGPCCLVCHLQLPPSSSSTCAPQWWATWRHSVLNPTPRCPVNRCRSCHSELQLVSARQQLAAFLQRVRWMPGCMWINKPAHVPRKQVGYEGNTSDVSAQPASSQDCEPSKGDPCSMQVAWMHCTIAPMYNMREGACTRSVHGRLAVEVVVAVSTYYSVCSRLC